MNNQVSQYNKDSSNSNNSIAKDPKKELDKMVQVYLESNPMLSNTSNASELEIRFSGAMEKI